MSMLTGKEKGSTKENNFLRNNLYLIKMVMKACPGRVFAEFVVEIIGYLSWIFYSIYFIKFVMRAIETGMNYNTIVIFLVFSAMFFGLFSIFETWYRKEYKYISDAVLYKKINRYLYEKAANVELECYEDTEFYNRYTLAVKEIDVRMASVLETMAAIVCGVVSAVWVVWNMYQIDHFIILFIAAPLIGNFVFGKLVNRGVFQRDKECIPYRRKMDYVNRTVYLSEYAKDFRMTNIFNVLREMHHKGFLNIISTIKKHENKLVRLACWQNIFTFFIIFQGVMYYSVYKTMVIGSITMSEYTVLSSAMVTCAWIFIRLSNNIVLSYENGLFVYNLRRFLEYEPKLSENKVGLIPEIPVKNLALKNVSFVYKGQDKPTICDITFEIHRGEKIAIVGHNGAGKSTLIKLLMRLYETSEGSIAYNGQNINQYNLKKYRELFGTAFQDYQIFALTVAENVLMREPKGEEDYIEVAKALKESDIYEKVMSLPKGMDTILTKEFAEDGAVLSGGEMQKITIARTFAKQYEIAIFDEPSSALDPIAEYRLYESMMEVCNDKTVIFISHRLSTAVLADRIYMLENGRIIESGSHNKLLQQSGKYADMFRTQAENYKEEVTIGGMAL